MKKVKKKVSLIIYWGKNRNIVQQQHAQKQFIELVSHQNKNGKKKKREKQHGISNRRFYFVYSFTHLVCPL